MSKGILWSKGRSGMQALCEGRDRSSTYPGSTLPRPLRQRASSKRSMTALSALYEHARDTRTSRCLRAGERHVSFSKNGLGMLSKRCFGRTGKQGMRGTVARVELRTPGRRNQLLASPSVERQAARDLETLQVFILSIRFQKRKPGAHLFDRCWLDSVDPK